MSAVDDKNNSKMCVCHMNVNCGYAYVILSMGACVRACGQLWCELVCIL